MTSRPPGRSSSSALATDVTADAVVDQGDAAGLRADLLVPAGLVVVDDEVGRRGRASVCVRGPRAAATTVAPAASADCTSSQPRPPAADGTSTTSSAAGRLELDDAQRGAAGADRGHRVRERDVVGHAEELVRRGDRLLGVPARHHARGARRPAGPARPGRRPAPTASTTPATSRPGMVGSSGDGNGPALAAADRGVEQVHAARLDGDPHLARLRARGRAARRGRGSSGGPKAWSRMACMQPSDKLKQG